MDASRGALVCRGAVAAVVLALFSGLSGGGAAASPDPNVGSTVQEDAPEPPTTSSSDHRVIASVPRTLAPGRNDAAWLTCPAGMVATGGGVHSSNAGGVVLLGSSPISGGAAWLTEIRNYSSEPVRFTGYAICRAGVADHEIRDTDGVGVDPAEVGSATTSCAGGRSVLGGGVGVTTTAMQVESTYPEPGGWSGTVRAPASSGSSSFRVDVVCGTGVQDHEIVGGDPVTFGPSGFTTATVTCPAGSAVLSAGGRAVEGSVVLSDVFPVTEQTWKVRALSRVDQPDAALQAWAVCGN